MGSSPPISSREFNQFINEHSRIINKVCWAYSTDKVPYEDLRQEIYTNLWLGLGQFRNESQLSTWVYRVAVNSALMAIRTYKPKLETTPIDMSVINSPDEDDTKIEKLKELKELISYLSPLDKAIILLWLDGYSYDEISEIMGMNRNSTATKLKRIKEKLTNIKS